MDDYKERHIEILTRNWNYLGPVINIDGAGKSNEAHPHLFPYFEAMELENRFFDLKQYEAQMNEYDYRGRMAYEEISEIRRSSTSEDLTIDDNWIDSEEYREVLMTRINNLEKHLGISPSGYNPNGEIFHRFEEGESIDHLIEIYKMDDKDLEPYFERGLDAPPDFMPFFRLSCFKCIGDVFIDKREMNAIQNEELQNKEYNEYINITPVQDKGDITPNR